MYPVATCNAVLRNFYYLKYVTILRFVKDYFIVSLRAPSLRQTDAEPAL